MKKIVLTMVALMAFMFSFAETNNNSADERFNISYDMRRLSVLLDLNEWQAEAVEVIQNSFNNEIQSLSTTKGRRLRQLVHRAVRNDATQMRRVLNDKQFDTYMLLLTTTLRNKHL